MSCQGTYTATLEQKENPPLGRSILFADFTLSHCLTGSQRATGVQRGSFLRFCFV